jgi:transcription antitermination factor NusG
MKKPVFAVGSYVRIKSGTFRGAIARVVEPHRALAELIRVELAEFPDYTGVFGPENLAPSSEKTKNAYLAKRAAS